MEPDFMTVLENLDLRVFAEYDDTYNLYVASCLDTGAVGTGNTLDEAEAVIKQVLENDIQLAMISKSLESLFHACAPPDVRARFYKAKAADPDGMRKITLEIHTLPKRGVTSELRIGRTRDQSSAA